MNAAAKEPGLHLVAKVVVALLAIAVLVLLIVLLGHTSRLGPQLGFFSNGLGSRAPDLIHVSLEAPPLGAPTCAHTQTGTP